MTRVENWSSKFIQSIGTLLSSSTASPSPLWWSRNFHTKISKLKSWCVRHWQSCLLSVISKVWWLLLKWLHLARPPAHIFSLPSFAALLFQRWSKSFSIPEAYVATWGGVWPNKKHWLSVGWVCLQTPGNICFTWLSVFDTMALSCYFVPCVLSESFLSVLWSLFTLQYREVWLLSSWTVFL